MQFVSCREKDRHARRREGLELGRSVKSSLAMLREKLVRTLTANSLLKLDAKSGTCPRDVMSLTYIRHQRPRPLPLLKTIGTSVNICDSRPPQVPGYYNNFSNPGRSRRAISVDLGRFTLSVIPFCPEHHKAAYRHYS